MKFKFTQVADNLKIRKERKLMFIGIIFTLLCFICTPHVAPDTFCGCVRQTKAVYQYYDNNNQSYFVEEIISEEEIR